MRCWFHYTKSLEGCEIEYGDCPQHCPREKKYDIYRRDLCKPCPRRAKRLEFERSTIRAWELWLNDVDIKKVDFDNTLMRFNSMLSVKDLPPEKMTVHTSHLVSIFESERARYEKITRDNA